MKERVTTDTHPTPCAQISPPQASQAQRGKRDGNGTADTRDTN